MIRILTLMENRMGEHKGLTAEHGLSFLIEGDGKRILFECGSGENTLKNAVKLNVDPASVDILAFSHSHYDHTGRIFSLLLSPYCPRRLLRRTFFDGRYVKKQDGMLDIGADIMPELFPCCGVSGVIVGSAPVKLHENRRHTTKRAAATRCPSRIGKDHRERLYAPSLFMQLMKHRFFRYFFRKF